MVQASPEVTLDCILKTVKLCKNAEQEHWMTSPKGEKKNRLIDTQKSICIAVLNSCKSVDQNLLSDQILLLVHVNLLHSASFSSILLCNNKSFHMIIKKKNKNLHICKQSKLSSNKHRSHYSTVVVPVINQ